MEPWELLRRIERAYCEALGALLTGIYVHGSLAFGCFDPRRSDIDFLVVTKAPPGPAQKQAMLRTLLALEPQAPPRGLEMSVVLARHCARFVYPTPFALHYSPMHRAAYLRSPAAFCAAMHGTDPDLAAHFTVTRAVGVALCGAPVASVFGPVPPEAFWDSICRDVQSARQDILREPVSVALNLCRAAAFRQGGLVLSKVQGGAWAAARLPAPYAAFARSAMEACLHAQAFSPPAASARAFADYMLGPVAAGPHG